MTRCAVPCFRVAAALLFREAVGVPRGELKFKAILDRTRGGNRVLRNHAAVPFHFHIEIVARQDFAAESEDVGETAGLKTMIEIIRYVGLENARIAFTKGAPAIDKPFRDVPDLSDVKMAGDELAVGQDEAGKGVGMSPEERFQFAQFHGVSIFLLENIVNLKMFVQMSVSSLS